MADRHLNDAETHVWLHNPATGGLWECPVDLADLYVTRLGWEYGEPRDGSLDGLVDEPVEQTGFNPSEHTAAEVSDYLALHADETPGEVSRVLELERADKNRKSVVVPDGFEPITGD